MPIDSYKSWPGPDACEAGLRVLSCVSRHKERNYITNATRIPKNCTPPHASVASTSTHHGSDQTCDSTCLGNGQQAITAILRARLWRSNQPVLRRTPAAATAIQVLPSNEARIQGRETACPR